MSGLGAQIFEIFDCVLVFNNAHEVLVKLGDLGGPTLQRNLETNGLVLLALALSELSWLYLLLPHVLLVESTAHLNFSY